MFTSDVCIFVFLFVECPCLASSSIASLSALSLIITPLCSLLNRLSFCPCKTSHLLAVCTTIYSVPPHDLLSLIDLFDHLSTFSLPTLMISKQWSPMIFFLSPSIVFHHFASRYQAILILALSIDQVSMIGPIDRRQRKKSMYGRKANYMIGLSLALH